MTYNVFSRTLNPIPVQSRQPVTHQFAPRVPTVQRNVEWLQKSRPVTGR